MHLCARDRHAVARDHHDGIHNRRSRRLLRNRKNDDVATLLPILLESFCGQALARCHPLNVLVGGALRLLPARVENGGLKSGAARGIWIALGSDIETSIWRTLH